MKVVNSFLIHSEGRLKSVYSSNLFLSVYTAPISSHSTHATLSLPSLRLCYFPLTGTAVPQVAPGLLYFFQVKCPWSLSLSPLLKEQIMFYKNGHCNTHNLISSSRTIPQLRRGEFPFLEYGLDVVISLTELPGLAAHTFTPSA